MAGLTSQGIGSGLDVAGLVAKLVAAEKAPRQSQITRAQTSTVTTISALANLKGAMGAFNDSLASLKTVDVFSARAVTASAPEFFTASATNAAVAGSYDIQIGNLASAHQLASDPFASGASQVVGTGTLSVSVGTKTFSVAVDDNHQTLAQIRDAINQATDNKDIVRATIVNASDGAHLVLSAQAAGSANRIVVAQSGGNGGLSSLEYNAGLTTNYTQNHDALDAVVYVAGFEHHSTTNTFENAVDGVTITLLKDDAGTEDDGVATHTLTVAKDTSGAIARIKKFADAYSDLAQQIASLRSYDPETKKAGPLLGDAMLRGIESELRNKLTSAVSGLAGDYQSLASVGITTQKDGSLKVDSAKLDKALAADFDGVAQLFGSTNGVATRLAGSLDAALATDAQINTRTKTLNAKSVSLQKEQAALETRMAEVAKRYNAQFNALDSLLSNLSSQSSFLTQQLTNISQIGDK
jgi:flagellar hook-associated protein 2